MLGPGREERADAEQREFQRNGDDAGRRREHEAPALVAHHLGVVQRHGNRGRCQRDVIGDDGGTRQGRHTRTGQGEGVQVTDVSVQVSQKHAPDRGFRGTVQHPMEEHQADDVAGVRRGQGTNRHRSEQDEARLLGKVQRYSSLDGYRTDPSVIVPRNDVRTGKCGSGADVNRGAVLFLTLFLRVKIRKSLVGFIEFATDAQDGSPEEDGGRVSVARP
mmetsp:Transcript_21807/g.51905  ORF Transcript_21807/g.51905 Transcript_21807/m.51905 type:complete len:218 (+) Transcript_21807:89-742(+)